MKRSRGLFKSRSDKSVFVKKVDKKFGKGFSKAVAATTITPVLGGQALAAFAKEAIKTASYKGINGPMRTDKRYTYQKKCDMYIRLFEQMMTPVVDDLDELITFQSEVLYRMVDDGMFINLNYEQFIRQLRRQYLQFPGIDEEDIDVYLEDAGVQIDLQALWVA